MHQSQLFDLLFSIQTFSCCFVVLLTVNIRTICEFSIISLLFRPSSLLIEKVPVEACKRAMLGTLVLKKERALLNTKFFEVTESKKVRVEQWEGK